MALHMVPAVNLLSATTGSLHLSEREEAEPCNGQARFDTIMCKSFMCTDCVLSWCTEQCQAWQLEYPGCRCEDWPEARKSFSTGDFAGKGTFGDAGDYSKK